MTEPDRTAFERANNEIINLDAEAHRICTEHINYYDGEILSVTLFSKYGYLVLKYLENNEIAKARLIIDLMEKYMNSGDYLLFESACTGFLESIDHKVCKNYPHQHVIDNLKSLLGKKSLDFCRGYEEFMTKETGEFWK